MNEITFIIDSGIHHLYSLIDTIIIIYAKLNLKIE